MTHRRADLCFDIYKTQSIKDVKRLACGDDDVESFFHFGSGQKPPKDFKQLMSSSTFKRELL